MRGKRIPFKGKLPDPAAFMDDPNWADFLPNVVPAGNDKCHLPAHEDCTPLDVERVESHLQPGGTLGTMDGYEARAGQLEMLRSVTRAFNAGEHLMVEAGTGVGKSLAYLIPSVQWSFVNDTPVILSTATRNLQSQLTESDLPRAASTLGADAPKFRWALLKGRANYLCLRMMSEYMQGGFWTLNEEEQQSMVRLIQWVHETTDGDLDDFGDEQLRPRLGCPSEDCAGHSCPFYQKCFVTKARARAMKAHVIVANHSLVMAEATNPGSGILPAYGRLVFDEAHNLEDIATDFFSFELSKNTLQMLLWKLAKTTKSRRGRGHTRGVLGLIERQWEKGAFTKKADADEVHELLMRAHMQMSFVADEGDSLFEVLKRLFSPSPDSSIIRFRCLKRDETQPESRQYSLHGLFADYTPAQWSEDALVVASARFEDALAKLQSIISALAKLLQAASVGDCTQQITDLANQAQALGASFTTYILESKFVLKASDPSRVYWAEMVENKNPKFRYKKEIRLVAAPLSIAKEMKRYFYDVKDSVVLCSATLRAGDKFDYSARKLGITLIEPSKVRTLVAASPFDYFRQVLALTPDFLPDVSQQPHAYIEALSPFLCELFRETKGRGLVLFTAYDMMRATADLIRPKLTEIGIDLLVQGEGISRESMVAVLKGAIVEKKGRKKKQNPVVLFGSQSFWEGVDVPGEALSCVVIARIPFPQMGEPIVEARCDKITEDGGKSFREFMIPEAQLRFRQGFGRLVRTKRDRGIVVVTDTRIATKNYGVLFKKSVPATFHSVSSMDEVLRGVKEFQEG